MRANGSDPSPTCSWFPDLCEADRFPAWHLADTGSIDAIVFFAECLSTLPQQHIKYLLTFVARVLRRCRAHPEELGDFTARLRPIVLSVAPLWLARRRRMSTVAFLANTLVPLFLDDVESLERALASHRTPASSLQELFTLDLLHRVTPVLMDWLLSPLPPPPHLNVASRTRFAELLLLSTTVPPSLISQIVENVLLGKLSRSRRSRKYLRADSNEHALRVSALRLLLPRQHYSWILGCIQTLSIDQFGASGPFCGPSACGIVAIGWLCLM